MLECKSLHESWINLSKDGEPVQCIGQSLAVTTALWNTIDKGRTCDRAREYARILAYINYEYLKLLMEEETGKLELGEDGISMRVLEHRAVIGMTDSSSGEVILAELDGVLATRFWIGGESSRGGGGLVELR